QIGALGRGRRHVVDQTRQTDAAAVRHLLEVAPELRLQLDRRAHLADAHGFADHGWCRPRRRGVGTMICPLFTKRIPVIMTADPVIFWLTGRGPLRGRPVEATTGRADGERSAR